MSGSAFFICISVRAGYKKRMKRGKKTQMLMTIHSSHRMSLIRSTALLLLCAIITLTNAQSACPALSDSTKTNTNYTLTTPPSVTNGITYPVTFASNSSTNGTVLLQVLSNNTSVGTWSSLPSGFASCTGGIWYNFTSGNFSLTANWTAPSSLNSSSVLFKALFNDTNDVYTANKTVTFATATTAATTAKVTTNGGPANHLAPMFFTLMETLFFLVVTRKCLS
ncbi:uncharacterized protein LOC120915463 isoform X2 [Rana temporaria]|uniref:uncharacterized protein LOC120915463 isoform X2 n=1 Tax=Rana temporaria TaxID=8407 RepID=UPI001AADF867|nr:uncharacterized protein LOC120915463 isoform X2 [Rana temporaria]